MAETAQRLGGVAPISAEPSTRTGIDRPRHISWFPSVTMAGMVAYIAAEHVAVDVPLGDYSEYLGAGVVAVSPHADHETTSFL
jgi:hypothetical protein